MEGEDFTVQEVIETLGLAPLPGGGWGRVMGPDALAAPGTPVSAYRLLTAEAAAEWRAVEAEELWTAYMGAPLEVEAATETGARRETITPGSGVWARAPAGGWVRSRSLGDWTLAGRIGLADEGAPVAQGPSSAIVKAQA